MSLEALAPDQRAVVQLVLQQERSYDELADLLGISPQAVRERALRGLERLAPAGDVDDSAREQVADYLLGQQSVSRREATRELLSSDASAREWAVAVSGRLSDVARGDLPEIPGADATAAPTPEPTPTPDLGTEVEVEGLPPRRPRPTTTTATAARPRPRPRPDAPKPRPATAKGPDGAKPNRSMLGGALLIAGIAIVLAVVVIVLVTGGGEDEEPAAQSTPTPTATADSEFQPVGQIPLEATKGNRGRGAMTLFLSQKSQLLAFTIQAERMVKTPQGEAYAVWLIGKGKPRRLGFAPPVGDDGTFGTSGPREQDAEKFRRWFTSATNVIVSRETSQDSTQPGPIVLQGKIPGGTGEAQG